MIHHRLLARPDRLFVALALVALPLAGCPDTGVLATPDGTPTPAPSADDRGPDEDGDGYGTLEGDCDDGDPDRHPGAEEVCDGVDWDCDGGANTRALASRAAGLPRDIPDNASITLDLPVEPDRVVDGVIVEVHIQHPWMADLELRLASPGGATVLLSRDLGGAGDGYVHTVFTDEASTAISEGVPPFTGAYRPLEPLALLTGGSSAGTWTLEVTDDSPLSTGAALAVRLSLAVAGPCQGDDDDATPDDDDFMPDDDDFMPDDDDVVPDDDDTALDDDDTALDDDDAMPDDDDFMPDDDDVVADDDDVVADDDDVVADDDDTAISCDATPVSCGDSVSGNHSGTASALGGYSCGAGGDGIETVYVFTPPNDGTVQVTLPFISSFSQSLWILGAPCDPASCVSGGGSDLSAPMTQGQPLYFVVEEESTFGPGGFSFDVTCSG